MKRPEEESWSFKEGWNFHLWSLEELIQNQKKDKILHKNLNRDHTRYIQMIHNHGYRKDEAEWNPRNDVWLTLDECVKLLHSSGDKKRNIYGRIRMRAVHINKLQDLNEEPS